MPDLIFRGRDVICMLIAAVENMAEQNGNLENTPLYIFK